MPPAGKPLGPNWQKEAKLRALTAEQHYRHTLENAWKNGSQDASEGNIMRSARLRPPSWSELVGDK